MHERKYSMITVVSGLPRSGTSLVMQMLEAGGHPILSDGVRSADEDNPRGYLELDKVRSLERDASWMHEAEGKAVKIISFLLGRLPHGFEYRVIFMRRDLNEVVRSQDAMLRRLGQPVGPSNEIMVSHFSRHLQQLDNWLSQQSHIKLFNCCYQELIFNSAATSDAIRNFLEKDLDLKRMSDVVCPELYRQRSGNQVRVAKSDDKSS